MRHSKSIKENYMPKKIRSHNLAVSWIFDDRWCCYLFSEKSLIFFNIDQYALEWGGWLLINFSSSKYMVQ